MDRNVTRESFDSLTSYWADKDSHLQWSSVFVLPAWMKVWWQEFGAGAELYLRAARQDKSVIGIAPLKVNDGRASIIGSEDVCDYLDFITVPGMEAEFFNALLDDLKKQGIKQLDLKPLRPDSVALTFLADIARNRGCQVRQEDNAVSLELELPATWDEYLEMLDKKQRHEMRRKLRRLWETDNVDYHCYEVGNDAGDFTDAFLKLFALSRKEKADFMTARMESFFRSLAGTMAGIGLLRFGTIKLGTVPASMIMGFDYNNSIYLYNSAYDPQYNYLSVGLLCKALCLKESIEKGKKKFDFLKGDEPYKYFIGGKEVKLYSCQITIE
jgi:CelD/BcsL family acetyltransferase involved in cellulose biosynthesis